jgi:HD superfamily phosphohydrolase
MKIIKDPVHGYVEVPDFALHLLDSPVLQRLRYIKQLGFSYLVYPGANHSRFEHSLGTMYLADIMSRQLDLSPGEHRLVLASALLHDIGHGPFSHAIEPLLQEFAGRSHHHVRDLLEEPETATILERHEISASEVVEIIEGRHPLAGIIHGELDVDRMDYLLRDAHYTGAPYGTVDAHRLIRNTLIAEGTIVLHESGINAAESLLIARTLMRPAVYFHHVSRIAEMMFSLAVLEHGGDDPGDTIEKMCRMDDAACMQALLNSPSDAVRRISKMLYQRQMFKRALYVGKDQVNISRLGRFGDIGKKRHVAGLIAEEAGCNAEDVLVDIPPYPRSMSIHVQVKNRHRLLGLNEISPLVNTLNETRWAQWRLGVYTLPEYRKQVSAAATEILHIKPLTTQEKLHF